MTKLLLSTVIAGFFALGSAAWAQGPDDHHGGPGGGAPGGGHDQHAAPAHAAPPARPAPPARQAPPARPAPAAAPDRGHMDQRPTPAAQPAPSRPARPDNAMRGPAPGNAMRGPAPGNAMRGPAPGNAMRGPGPGSHPDYTSYHRNFSAAHRFHAPAAYRRPRGWYSHRWTFGEILPALFWTQDYWISDYTDFDLMPPPPGTVWVRDGSDALLIDQYSGEIIQVDYGVFY